MIEDVKKRIDREFPMIEPTLYLNSLLNLVEVLTGEFEKKLKLENRYSGMAKSYINSMWETISYTNQEIDSNEEELFERILYLFKKQIQKDYNNLVLRKRLSQGDASVVIIKQLLETIEEKMPDDYEYGRRVRTLIKLITKFYDNIRNTKKDSNLFDLKDSLKGCFQRGKVGRHRTKKIDLVDLRRNIEMLELLENPGERVDLGNEVDKITEVELL